MKGRDRSQTLSDEKKLAGMTDAASRIGVYTGSFDPITLGHLNMIERSRWLVDRLIVGVGINIEKRSLFSPDERVELASCVTASYDNVEVRTFSGLAVDFVRQCGARLMIRGVRPLSDMPICFLTRME